MSAVDSTALLKPTGCDTHVLILSRREGEAVLLDGGIRLVIVSCDRRGVRLGIEAPPEVGIIREELVGKGIDADQSAPGAGPGTDGSEAAEPGEPVKGALAKLPETRPPVRKK